MKKLKLATLILGSKVSVTPFHRKMAPSYTKSRRKPSFLPLPPPPSRRRSSIKHNSKFSPLTFSIEVEAFYVTEKRYRVSCFNSIQWSWIQNEFLHLNLASTWDKNILSGNISFYLDSKWAFILPWTTAVEFLKIHQPNVDILQFEASNFCLFLPVFALEYWKSGKNKQKLLASNCNVSTLGW